MKQNGRRRGEIESRKEREKRITIKSNERISNGKKV